MAASFLGIKASIVELRPLGRKLLTKNDLMAEIKFGPIIVQVALKNYVVYPLDPGDLLFGIAKRV